MNKKDIKKKSISATAICDENLENVSGGWSQGCSSFLSNGNCQVLSLNAAELSYLNGKGYSHLKLREVANYFDFCEANRHLFDDLRHDLFKKFGDGDPWKNYN